MNEVPESEALIEEILPFVGVFLARYARAGDLHRSQTIEDLRGVAILALMRGVEKYNEPFRKGKIVQSICSAVLDELRRIDPLPRRVRARSRKIDSAAAELAQRFGREPTAGELAAFLKEKVRDVELAMEWSEMARRGEAPDRISLAGGIEWGGGIGHSASPVDEIVRREIGVSLRESLKRIPDEEARAIEMVYIDGMTKSEAAASIGKSKAWVGRLCKAGLERMRKHAALKEVSVRAA